MDRDRFGNGAYQPAGGNECLRCERHCGRRFHRQNILSYFTILGRDDLWAHHSDRISANQVVFTQQQDQVSRWECTTMTGACHT